MKILTVICQFKKIYLLLGEVKKLKAELDGLIRKESLDEQS